MKSNQVHVKFFAAFREMIGLKEDWVEPGPALTVGALWTRYTEKARNPGVANMRAAFSVNRRLAPPDTVLQPGDEVGFLPPVSGGAGVKPSARKTVKRITLQKKRATRPSVRPVPSITRRSLDLGALIRRVEDPGAGAIVTFSGTVRNNSHGQATRFLEYEAYPELAEETLEQIAAEIHSRWPDVRLAMGHRIGRLKIGQASVLIAASAPHRAEAFAACRFAIERIKAVLPVWKKEFSTDHDFWVEGPVAGDKTAADADRVVGEAGAQAE